MSSLLNFFTLVLVASSFLTSGVRAQDGNTKIPADIDGNNIAASAQSSFCQGQQSKHGLAAGDGTQNKAGSCSSTVQGSIPSFDTMVSTMIVNPQNGATIDASKNITITIDLLNIETGFFADPNKQYYLVPQTVNSALTIEGHSHVTVQTLSSTSSALDPRTFAFFKGLNIESTDGRTLSTTIVAGTLKTNGQHRICSLAGSFTHQPVIMPVAQRGAQDDCIRVTVQNAGSSNNAAGGGAAASTTTTTAASGGRGGRGGRATTTTTTTTAAAAQATTTSRARGGRRTTTTTAAAAAQAGSGSSTTTTKARGGKRTTTTAGAAAQAGGSSGQTRTRGAGGGARGGAGGGVGRGGRGI